MSIELPTGTTRFVEIKRRNSPSPFLEHIGRSDLKCRLSKNHPIVSWQLEITRRNKDAKGEGGLGILKGCESEIYQFLGVPIIFISPFYPYRLHQEIHDFKQDLVEDGPYTPEQFGFEKKGRIEIKTRDCCPAILTAYEKIEGSVRMLDMYDPNFKWVYWGKNNSDHRVYQMVSLGFGGWQILDGLNVHPRFNQINESGAGFAALAGVDRLAKFNGLKIAKEMFRENSGYVNHTVVPAAEPTLTSEQYEKYVIPNLNDGETIDWLRWMINKSGGSLKPVYIPLELTGVASGVSLFHSETASKTYHYFDGKPVQFKNITNGISLERWWNPLRVNLFREKGILDEFDLPGKDYQKKIDNLDENILENNFENGRKNLRKALLERKDQYSQPINIPDKALTFAWFKRLASYKQPDLPFYDPDKLADLLEKSDAYFLMAGKAHSTDTGMQEELTKLLKLADSHPILKKRFIFVQDYEENLSRPFVQGCDMVINIPTNYDPQGNPTSTEACGTSWMKVEGILIATEDGGMADPREMSKIKGKLNEYTPPYLRVEGRNKDEQAASLYEKMQLAVDISNDKARKWKHLKTQWGAFLPVSCGSRQIRDTLNLYFPKQ